MKLRGLACIAVALTAAAVSLRAQSTPAPVESRLLEILHQKGVIDAKERAELESLGAEMRKESDLEAALDANVNSLVHRLSTQEATGSDYKIGRGFVFDSRRMVPTEHPEGDHRLIVGGRLQLRGTFTSREDTDNRDEWDFSIPRARIWFQGFVFDKDLTYKFQIDVVGDPVSVDGDGSSEEFTTLRDANIDYRFADALHLTAGQFKTPYSRQWILSTTFNEFVERSPINAEFTPQREIGVMLWGHMGGEDDHLFEYYAGVFNGEGSNFVGGNNDEGLMFLTRFVLQPFGLVPETETDFRAEGERDDLLLAFAVNAFFHMDDNHTGFDNEDFGIGADLALFWCGFHFLGEFHYRDTDPGVTGVPDDDRWGFLAQLGYAIIPEVLDLGVRAAYLEGDDDGSTDFACRSEYLLAASYYWFGHFMKIQGDFGRVETEFFGGASVVDWRFRIQFQIVF